MKRWEFKTFRWKASNGLVVSLLQSSIEKMDVEIDAWLCGLGAEGWEPLGEPRQSPSCMEAMVTCKREALDEPKPRPRFYRLQGMAIDGSPVTVDVEDRDLDIPAYDTLGNMFEARTFDFCVNNRLIRCQIDRALLDRVAPSEQEAFILSEQRSYILALGVFPDSLLTSTGRAPFKEAKSTQG